MEFKRLGIMLDMSRNAVMHVRALKEYISTLSDMGYNTLLLYTEDTYEIPGEPYFGHFRGRYSQTGLDRGPDFVLLARAYGLEAQRAETLEEFERAFARLLEQGRGGVIDCTIGKDEHA